MEDSKTFLNERLTYRLNLIAQRAIAENDDIFVRETGCRIRELRVLRLIDDSPGTNFANINRSTGLERSLTSRILQDLISKGLILRENSDTDARVFRLKTTEKGTEIRRISRQVSNRLDKLLTDPLSSEELEQLDNLLERLATWVDSEAYREALNRA